MKSTSHRRPIPFPFIIDELQPLRPTLRSVFGFTHVYLEDRLLFSLRDATTQTGSNGMWLYTTTEHADTLAREFPDLPRRQIWRSGKKAWIVLASRLPDFEEQAFRACELILRRDQRIGRLSRSLGKVESGSDRTLRRPLGTVRER
ncbi:MAG TPA: hypothetical protein VFH15_08540 [Pyrinomonadaceae bacterium]|nr:hypothetical protein [Pyrinomonadaceae bacterium]